MRTPDFEMSRFVLCKRLFRTFRDDVRMSTLFGCLLPSALSSRDHCSWLQRAEKKHESERECTRRVFLTNMVAELVNHDGKCGPQCPRRKPQ